MKIILAVAAAPLVVIAMVTTAWAVDDWRDGSSVARNVVLAGTPVGGMRSEELEATVRRLAEELPATEVRIEVGDEVLRSTAGALGIGVDVEATVRRVERIGTSDPLPTRPVRWLRSLFSPRRAEVALSVDAERVASTLRALEGDRRQEPVEPTLRAGETVEAVEGTPGREITVHDVVQAIPRSLDDLSEPIVIPADQAEIPTRLRDEDVARLARQANEVTEGEVTLVAGGRSYDVDGRRFRPAFALGTGEEGEPVLTMGAEAVAALLDEVVQPPANPTGVRFEIRGGTPVPVGGRDAEVCCAEGAELVIVEGLLTGETTIELPTRTVTAAQGREWAAGLGVREVIGEFTTHHACCESRVTNIHRIADLTRGILIAPGETFSVNDTVGPRTREKGFAEGGVIVDGEFTTDIGGGVSQYATTLFNAAFFGGLDIPQYKAHSKYISRYPYGREATLYYPSVDLKIRNNTPHGVVIWPTYTGTSITVQLWSTRYVAGEQTGQSRTSGCGKVTTERTRVYVDGRVEKDTFHANYDCD